MDEKAVLSAAKETGAIVTIDEAQLAGGLGSAVAEYLVGNCPVPIEMVGIKDTFLECGLPDELAVVYNLKARNFVDAAKRAVSRKQPA